MENNFGVIVCKENIQVLKELCDKWENEKWFTNYSLLIGEDNWVSIFDENLEWGNIDVFIQIIFSANKETILSVEYFDGTVRYKLWENGRCVGEQCTGWDIASYNCKREYNTLFATKLRVNNSLLSKIFSVNDAKQSIILMECLLQCQLCPKDEWIDKNKLLNAKYYSKGYIKKYFKEQVKVTITNEVNEKVFVDAPIAINGNLLDIKKCLIVYHEENGIYIFNSVSYKGEIQGILKIPSNMLSYFFWTKNYIGDGMIGFLTKDDEFVLYEQKQNHVVAKFPNIKRTATTSWFAYMPDKDTIFMEWACYDVRSGEKKWDFPLPVDERAYNIFLERGKCCVLPNGLVMTQINIDQENIYISLMDQVGNLTNSVSVKISYAYYNVGVTTNYIYIIQAAETAGSLVKIILLDFELNEIGRYEVESNMIDYRVCFDVYDKNFYVLDNERIMQVNIISREKHGYPIPFNKIEISSWGILPNNILYVVKNSRELFFIDFKKNTECILKHKIKGYYEKLISLDNGNLLLISQNSKNSKIILQEICFIQQCV